MKAGNLPDLIKYLTVIYFSLFSVFLCYTDDARVTEFRKYAVQSNSYGIINYNIHSQALSAMSDLIYTGGDFMQILCSRSKFLSNLIKKNVKSSLKIF